MMSTLLAKNSQRKMELKTQPLPPSKENPRLRRTRTCPKTPPVPSMSPRARLQAVGLTSPRPVVRNAKEWCSQLLDPTPMRIVVCENKDSLFYRSIWSIGAASGLVKRGRHRVQRCNSRSYKLRGFRLSVQSPPKNYDIDGDTGVTDVYWPKS